jgi:hypothetical protein
MVPIHRGLASRRLYDHIPFERVLHHHAPRGGREGDAMERISGILDTAIAGLSLLFVYAARITIVVGWCAVSAFVLRWLITGDSSWGKEEEDV